MKISRLAFAGILSGTVSAQYYDSPDPYKEPPLPSYSGEATATSLEDKYVTHAPEDSVVYGSTPTTTAWASITEYAYGGGKQTIYVCPPVQSASYDCTEAVYDSEGKVITVVVINITVKIEYGEPTSVTITKPEKPTYTPIPLPSVYSTVVNSTNVAPYPIPPTSIPSTTSVGYSQKPYYPLPSGTGLTSYLTNPPTAYSTVPYTTSTGTASPHYPTHHVHVGQNGYHFYPPYVKAEPGDTVRFTFYPKNHTVTTCDFEEPCSWNGKYDSGYTPTWYKNSTAYVDFRVRNVSEPLWFYSRQEGECKKGMVFGINPKSPKQFKEFYEKAKYQSPPIVAPGPPPGYQTGPGDVIKAPESYSTYLSTVMHTDNNGAIHPTISTWTQTYPATAVPTSAGGGLYTHTKIVTYPGGEIKPSTYVVKSNPVAATSNPPVYPSDQTLPTYAHTKVISSSPGGGVPEYTTTYTDNATPVYSSDQTLPTYAHTKVISSSPGGGIPEYTTTYTDNAPPASTYVDKPPYGGNGQYPYPNGTTKVVPYPTGGYPSGYLPPKGGYPTGYLPPGGYTSGYVPPPGSYPTGYLPPGGYPSSYVPPPGSSPTSYLPPSNTSSTSTSLPTSTTNNTTIHITSTTIPTTTLTDVPTSLTLPIASPTHDTVSPTTQNTGIVSSTSDTSSAASVETGSSTLVTSTSATSTTPSSSSSSAPSATKTNTGYRHYDYGTLTASPNATNGPKHRARRGVLGASS
ncbi:hypothetical protein BJ875DRAFT_1523 [Amylocarpus encephaloides]|uniref:Uncharacterized protein n=1 Tax=Amylocarpus encephaloides TaxID=45428 RepID=A0A9P7YU03_9HELO|nr:hypothetical protein BJ875DRAFT_1523 [Amylocarpus encephaloides]